MPSKLYTIDELSRASGITTRTIRFYAQEKLLPPPKDFRGRVALYGPEHLEKLKLIKVLKDKYLPLDMIRKIAAHPEKIGDLKHKLLINGEVFRLLGFKPAILTLKQLAQKSRFSEKEIARLVEFGFLLPTETETGLRYTADDLDIINFLKQFGKLGFKPGELAFIPETLERLADKFFETGHKKLHARESKEPMDVIEAVIRANKELIGLIYQRAIRRAIDRHRQKKGK